MTKFKVAPCTVDDVHAIAHVNVLACWENEQWALMWTQAGKTQEYVISQAVPHWSYILLGDPIRRRQEKVVNVGTGELIGFAQWILPKTNEAGKEDEAAKQEIGKLWPEARSPRTDDETLKLLKERFEDTEWENTPDSGADLKNRLRGDKRWLGEFIQLIYYITFYTSITSLLTHLIVLGYIIVYPDYERQGVGSLLLESGVRAAEKMGLDIFVTSTKAGQRLYHKAGFSLLNDTKSESSDDRENQAYFSWSVEKHISDSKVK
jgi:GNAT superfamily N-acetyltransferase